MGEGLSTGTVTLLVTDLDDVAQLGCRRDDILATNGGMRLDNAAGRGLAVAFTGAADAVQCAVDLQRAACPARLRIGLHTGDASCPIDLIGHADPLVKRAEQLRDLAHGGQTILSRITADLVVDRLSSETWLTDLGTYQLREQPRPEHILQLCHVDLPNRFPSLRTAKGVVSQSLPIALTRFIGRNTEIDELTAIVADDRLVTLTGAGGIGKTRLAVEVAVRLAGEFTDGVWYVDLAPITDPDLVAVTVARTQGLPDKPGRSTTEALCRAVGDHEILLLLDNCEHLLDASGALINALLHACPSLTILTTSREPIGVQGERVWAVPTLSVADEAIELFADRAQHARADFCVTDANAPTVADICRRLDGIPLAIELAAARVAALSLNDIAEHLHDRFRLLTLGSRAAFARHQTLRASVDWSHALLTDAEQTLFRRLGVFFGGFDLDAARTVASCTAAEREQMVDLLSLLVYKSLVIAESTAGTMRYRMLETIRQYALEKLGEAGEGDIIRDRHRDHFTELAEAIASPLQDGPARPADWADVEIDNLRAAFVRSRENGDLEKALRLASALQYFWLSSARLREGLTWFDAVVTDADEPGVAPEVWVRAVMRKIAIAGWLQDTRGPAQAEAALTIARDIGDPALIAVALNGCSVLSFYEPEKARTYLDEAATLAQASNDQRTLCETRLYQALLYNALGGDPVRARAAAEESHDLAVALGDRYTQLHSRIWLGCALHFLGNLEDASRILLSLIEEDRSTPQLFNAFLATIFMGRVRAYQGLADAAGKCGEETVATASRSDGFLEDAVYAMVAEAALAAGDGPAARRACEISWQNTVPVRMPFTRTVNPMAEALLACGELAAARHWADDTVAAVTGFHRAVALTARAYIALVQGEPERAACDAYDALGAVALTSGFLRLPDIVEILARLASDECNHRNAARLFGAADMIRRQTGIARFPMYQADYCLAVESSRKALDTNMFDAEWEAGARLSIEDAIAYLLRGRGKRKRPRIGWESLTPTEVEVVGLVAAGLTNKDIATRLLMSHRTVQTHLTHVYLKLGCSSRVQLVQETVRRA